MKIKVLCTYLPNQILFFGKRSWKLLCLISCLSKSCEIELKIKKQPDVSWMLRHLGLATAHGRSSMSAGFNF